MAPTPPEIDFRPVANFEELAPLWRDLERRAACSFFQSWAWTGCLAEERFTDPCLLTARENGVVVGLALFNRTAGRAFPGLGRARLSLGESGVPTLDTIFIEHTGLLLDRSADDGVARCCWAALAGQTAAGLGGAHWILSGVPEGVRDCLPSDRRVRLVAQRPAPHFDLASGGPGAAAIDRFSANTRQQLRRSLRAWEEIGPLRLEFATAPEEADAWLDALADLHQRYWVSRGKAGAFAEPFFGRFHHALIRRAAAGQSIDLIRVSAGDRIVGYLYNFVHDGWVAAYQSGFDFGADADRLRPGMVCHLLAIEHYRRSGLRLYDFLGGEARYKRSLADGETALLWLQVRPKLPWQSGRRTAVPSGR